MAKNQTQNSNSVSISPSQSVNEPKKPSYSLEKSPFSKKQLALFALVFALIGGVALWRAFAAAPLLASVEGEKMITSTVSSVSSGTPQTTTQEAETMNLPAGRAAIISDASSSNGQTVEINTNASITTKYNATQPIRSFVISARSSHCASRWANLVFSVDGTQLFSQNVKSTTYTTLTVPVNLVSGSHDLNIGFTNDYYRARRCDINLYVDKIQIITSTPSPTPVATGTEITNDSTASNGQSINLYMNGEVSAQFNVASPVASMTVIAKGTVCDAVGADMSVSVDGKLLISANTKSSSWQSFSMPASFAAGAHKLTVAFTNDAYTDGVCDRNLYIDKTDFFGTESVPQPNAPPTVTLSASPSSVTAGQASILTWNSTNATSCIASGAWSGAQNTSGSITTGALNQNSTYSLSCSGVGGTVSTSSTITVSNAAPPPNSTGTVRHAGPGQVLSAIDASQPGDTVIVDSGNHPQLVLSKSFAAPGITVKNSGGAVFAGIDTNGQSGYNFDGISSILPAEVNNYDITPFYLHGGSQRINLVGAFKLQGGYDGIKVYGGSKDCTIDDGGAASSISGYGGDGIHVNQSTNLWIKSVNIGNPYDLTATPEHNDGIHAQDFNNLRIGGGAAGGIVRITGLVTANSPRSDVDSAGMFLRGEPGASGLTIDGVEIHWQIGRAIQIIDIDGATTIRTLKITDSGIPGSSPAITFDGRYNVDVYGPLTGFSKSDCYIVGSGSITWH